MIEPEFLSRLSSVAPVRCNEPLAKHTSLRIGGAADAYIVANSPKRLRAIMSVIWEYDIPYLILGAGSNLLVSDTGFRGVVVENWVPKIDGMESGMHMQEENGKQCMMKVDGGIPLARLAFATSRAGWAGLEWAVGIPGSVAGAVVNNSGAHGGSMGDIIQGVWVVERGGEAYRIPVSELGMEYRASNIRYRWRGEGRTMAVLSVEMALQKEDLTRLKERMTQYSQKRRNSQPSQPSAGSMFKNPSGHTAGWLIEQTGLKGHRVGGAQVSTRHANFVVNRGRAQASDVEELMALAKQKVVDGFGIELEPEVEWVGEKCSREG
ncbi:MAG: UDP-N-acetylenolpyruvoylglucosamine reductase [Dehalococcoidia bacterium]|nr:UDP-N-acetylenolpyruvoylglucosamine reductase [Dehalococcoidia bacterium]